MSEYHKYRSLAKAYEYASMCWPGFGTTNVSEPFYRHIADLIREVLHLIDTPRPQCVEFGYGAGRHLYELQKSFSHGSILGVESSYSMMDVAIRMLRHRVPEHRIAFAVGDIQATCIRDVSADFVLAVNVLDRVPNTAAALSEIVRIVKPDGIILCASAFDYLGYTPPEQRLAPDHVEDTLAGSGCRILSRENTVLRKDCGDGTIREFEEVIFVIRKR